MTRNDAPSTLTLSCNGKLITRAVDRVIATHRALDRAVARHTPIRRVRIDRRRSERLHIRVPVDLTPVEEHDGILECLGATIIGVTRDIAPSGMGFSHDQPLTSRLVLAEFDICRTGPVQLLLERRWHRRSGTYSFSSGGIFTAILLED